MAFESNHHSVSSDLPAGLRITALQNGTRASTDNGEASNSSSRNSALSDGLLQLSSVTSVQASPSRHVHRHLHQQQIQGILADGSTTSNRNFSSTMVRKVSESDLGEQQASKRPRTVAPGQKSPLLLARSEDLVVLNDLHVFCRQQIEVFTATPSDMAQPAPGRKNPIRLHQVGLRCIHCKNLRQRVKRAVCYPSSVGRVYHSVSDMKFDHFGKCPGLSLALREEFEQLKEQCSSKRGDASRKSFKSGSTSSTAQYYHDAACRMGMVDRSGGIFMSDQMGDSSPVLRAAPQQTQIPCPIAPKPAPVPIAPFPDYSKEIVQVSLVSQAIFNMDATASNGIVSSESPTMAPPNTCQILSGSTTRGLQAVQSVPPKSTLLLASPSDAEYLNALHCFVRRNVEVFVATKEDIAAPSPGRKVRVVIGQVGIRCIHCSKLPPRDRVKRAVCYPPTVSGIYHSVSNMKFDHFERCKGLPDAIRQEFHHLRATCHRRGGSTSSGAKGMSNSTAQFYHDSALRLGLNDSEQGIRMAVGEKCDGISALVVAASNQTDGAV